MSDIKSVSEKLVSLYGEYAKLWIEACRLEQADPASVAVELSDKNPYKRKLAELNSQVHQFEHTLRYYHSLKRKRDSEITGGVV
jgi:hypothetical protein